MSWFPDCFAAMFTLPAFRMVASAIALHRTSLKPDEERAFESEIRID